jgi:hypothetical protein
MFIAHGQSHRFASGRMPRRPRRFGGLAQFARRQRIECLENRRLLNAAPFATPLATVPAAWVGPFEAIGPIQMNHASSGGALGGPSDGPSDGPSGGPAMREAPMTLPWEPQPITTQDVTWERDATASGAEPPTVEVVLIPAAAARHEDTTLSPNFFARPQVGEPLFADSAIVRVELFRAPPGSSSADEQATSSSVGLPDPRAFDPGLERAIFFVPESWQPGEPGGLSGSGEITFDVRERPTESLRGQLSDGRLVMSPLDGVRASNGALAYFDAAADGERHASAGVAALFGQNAEAGAPFAGGRAVGTALFGEAGNLGDSSAPVEVAQQSAVGYLVAIEEAFRRAAAGAYSASVDAAQQGAEQAASSLVQEVLVPHFAFDAAALTAAVNELADQADELGVGLWEMLSPIATGEAALVAGIVAAGIVYRHWRGTRRDEGAEEQDLLSSRFIRGHASLRIARGPS